MPHTKTKNRRLILIGVGAYLLSIPYSTTFLLPLLIELKGGDEADVGYIISTATISTVIFVILSGYILEKVSAELAISIFSVFTALACFGFSFIESIGVGLIFSGLSLGIGWGVFFTLGPILIARLYEGKERVRYFALLSGCMMCGYVTAPLIGGVFTQNGLSINFVYYFAIVCSLIGGTIFLCLHFFHNEEDKTKTQNPSGLSFSSIISITKSKAIYPIIMVGILGCIFGGMATFQISYAKLYSFDYRIFYIFFMFSIIFCRLILAPYVVKKNPYISSVLFSVVISISILLFVFVNGSQMLYIFASTILGIGYGLIHFIVNGLAASESPKGTLSQSLIMYSMSYLIGAFGFPLISGEVIVNINVQTLFLIIFLLSLINCLLSCRRLWGEIYGRQELS